MDPWIDPWVKDWWTEPVEQARHPWPGRISSA